MNLNSYIASHRKTVLLLSLISIFLSPLVFSDSGFINYKILKKDTLFSISNKFNIELSDLYGLNPEIGLNPDIIKFGQILIIPNEDSYSSDYCSLTGAEGDSKNIYLKRPEQFLKCFEELDTQINLDLFNEIRDINWKLVDEDLRYQIYINNKVVYLLDFEPENPELKKYLSIIHDSALRGNETSVMGIYFNEFILDEYDGVDITSWETDYEKYFEIELSEFGKMRRDILLSWENTKYYSYDTYLYYKNLYRSSDEYSENIDPASIQYNDLSFSAYDRFCKNDVYQRPTTFHYELLLTSNLTCASFYDDWGDNNWKKHMDRSYELLKRSKTKQIYGAEIELIYMAAYFSNVINDIDYFDSFINTFSEKKCTDCENRLSILDYLENYVETESATIEQVDSIRYMRMNVLERLGRSNFYGADYVVENGDVLIDILLNDIEYFLSKKNREQAASFFEATLNNVFFGVIENLTHIGECQIAENYYNQIIEYDWANLHQYYAEDHEANFLTAISLANCYQTYFDSNDFFVNEENFNIKVADSFIEEAKTHLAKFMKSVEITDGQISMSYGDFSSEVIIFQNYLTVVTAYNLLLKGDLEKSKEVLNSYKSIRELPNEFPMAKSIIIDNTITRYAELFLKLSLLTDKNFPDPINEKLFKNDKLNSLKKGNDQLDNRYSQQTNIENIQDNLKVNEQALVFFSSPNQSKILLIRNDDLYLFDTVGSFEIDYFTNLLRDSLNSADLNDFDFDTAGYLFDILIYPYEEYINKDSIIKIIGSDHMSVPFSVFVRDYDIDESNINRKLITADWVINNYNFVRVFSGGKTSEDNSYQEKFLGISNSSSYTWSGLPDLSETKREIARLGISSNARRDLILNNNDTKEDFLLKLNKSYERIVIATHSVPPFWNGATFEASLLFQSKKGDFFLTPSEITKYDFSSDMVVLSSCNTSSNSSINLFNAFILSGAKSVVHSNWNLESKYASKFTTSFFEDLWLNQKPKHEAIRDISIKFMSDYSDLKNIHPSYWGNFSIIYSDF